MAKPTEIQGLLTQVKRAADKLKTKIFELDDQIEALYKSRDGLIQAPLSKADYMATIRADIQAKARLFTTYLARHLDSGNPINYPAMLQKDAGSLPVRYLDAGANVGGEISEGAYYLYFEDAIAAGVERALVGKEWPVDAMPTVEREKALKGMAVQIDALTVERDALAGELTSCGLTE